MKNRFAEDVETHAVHTMEDKDMKTYRQKMLGDKQQHGLEMHLLENERRIAWNSDRGEQSNLLPRLENINKRILDINNKENLRQQVQPTTPLQKGYLRTTSSKKSKEREKNAAIGIIYPDVYQDPHGVTQKQGSIKLDSKTKPFKSRATSLPEHPFIQRTLYHIPVKCEGNSDLEPTKDNVISLHKLPSKNKKKHDHKRHSKSTNEENNKERVKPRLVRRPRMDAKVLASLLNVDESSVEKQDQVFQRARLKAGAALRVVLAGDTQENADGNEQKKKTKKKTSAKIQRRTSVASTNLSTDLLKVGFPALNAGEQTWRNTYLSPASSSANSRARRSSLPSLSTTNYGSFMSPGSTATSPTRRASIGSTKFTTSSLDKLENVIEENEENSERDDTISNLIQSVLPLSRRKKQLYGQQ
ncbi:uncharacterized protein LOC118416876 [Branchiostoma floridae]|uniref:Uncharacterized protein LOC118416876 n=1 Tax=Branchiostoma floridae TaxID=7739 RepID=A0A9J7L8J8_BRAFL|nr:uncharacterized protein LOC118416876 [Branchiostoma floridae]